MIFDKVPSLRISAHNDDEIVDGVDSDGGMGSSRVPKRLIAQPVTTQPGRPDPPAVLLGQHLFEGFFADEALVPVRTAVQQHLGDLRDVLRYAPCPEAQARHIGVL